MSTSSISATSGAISFGGLATGLDTASIVSQLVAIQRQPILNLQSQRSAYDRQLAALNDLKSKLTAIRAAAAALDTATEFGSLRATSANEAVVKATAGGDATEGSYEIVVNSLARAQKEISQGFGSQVAEVGAGTVTITVGGVATQITLAPGDSSLTSLRNAINDSGAGVRATILNDGSGTTPYRLVLTAATTGTDAAFTADFSGLSGGTAPALTNITAAANASVSIDTVMIASQTNTITEAIGGLTLNLVKQDPGVPVTVSVDVDAAAIEDKVQKLVDAYNDLMTFVKTQSAEGGTLRGNGLMRSVSTRAADLMSSPLTSALGSLTMAAQVGIAQSDGGQIAFDKEKFAAALSEDFGAVRDLFVERGTNQGLAYRFRAAIDTLTDSKDGLFKISSDAIAAKQKQIDSRIDRLEVSAESYQQMLERKFTAMEMLISGLQGQSNYLTQQYTYATSSK